MIPPLFPGCTVSTMHFRHRQTDRRTAVVMTDCCTSQCVGHMSGRSKLLMTWSVPPTRPIDLVIDQWSAIFSVYRVCQFYTRRNKILIATLRILKALYSSRVNDTPHTVCFSLLDIANALQSLVMLFRRLICFPAVFKIYYVAVSWKPNISGCTRPIFTKFPGLVLFIDRVAG